MALTIRRNPGMLRRVAASHGKLESKMKYSKKQTVRSANATVNHACDYPHASGGPRKTDGGKDLGRSATNSMGKFKNKPVSPNANAASINAKG